MPRRPYSRRILVREGRAEPATSVRGATHIQLVSRATRDQADPLAPAGRRFGNFVFGARTIDHAAAAGRALGATGYRQTGGTERSALSCPVDLTRAESSCARGAPSQRRRSAERPTFSWSAERPAIRPTRWRRLGGASAISFLGRADDRSCCRRRPRAGSYGVSPNRRH